MILYKNEGSGLCNMDKNKIYCPICNKELIKENGNYKYNCKCYENKKFKYTLQWCENCQKFTSRRGIIKGSKCCRCAVRLQHKTIRETDPEGYAKRQAAATVKANEKMKAKGKGVWGKEQHILAEETKRKRGLDLGNPEFRKKIGCNGGLWAKNLSDEEKNNYYQKLLNNGFSRPNSFKTENNILYYYDKLSRQYVPWEDYKTKFNRKRLTKDIESFINSLKSLDIFQPKNMGPVESYDIDEIVKLYPTFRTQESDSWGGAYNAFEQNLVDNDINWFVYIKFFIDQLGCVKPLVVGKSGSLNVNANGSDVVFSTNINDGPSRRFLIETKGANWDKTQILIIKAKSEQQALFYEWKIANIYGLFES